MLSFTTYNRTELVLILSFIFVVVTVLEVLWSTADRREKHEEHLRTQLRKYIVYNNIVQTRPVHESLTRGFHFFMPFFLLLLLLFYFLFLSLPLETVQNYEYENSYAVFCENRFTRPPIIFLWSIVVDTVFQNRETLLLRKVFRTSFIYNFFFTRCFLLYFTLIFFIYFDQWSSKWICHNIMFELEIVIRTFEILGNDNEIGDFPGTKTDFRTRAYHSISSAD